MSSNGSEGILWKSFVVGIMGVVLWLFADFVEGFLGSEGALNLSYIPFFLRVLSVAFVGAGIGYPIYKTTC
ncbi:hypothetical protein AKJ45_01800 [candidate division MSBL1 archaeon SCGC-AAA261F19]|uniref:Uncharacterized protein n=2 Tax=candidate division MSBL1 TaxID=215777 RepID=A0A133UXV5_9EURY|nr:hypothetical protein AKJ42_03855 [candidate division MSBL1 archaeon SCGC-AAA261C02]KXB03371.1 hypothetical protein AKJ45_01800 [candidate division MSBL1 archaeon SCGC-AAA261F19]